MRRVAEVVEVTTRRGLEGAVPLAFTWHGRSYTVREVLGQWRERRPWWRGVVEGLDPAPRGLAGDAGAAAHELEERVWRVAASPGRALHCGVYELGHAGGWRLLRIED